MYYILELQSLVKKELAKCNLCNRSKASRHLLYRLLQLINALEAAWKVVTIDFIVKLLPSKELMTETVFNSIFVVVDKLTKYRHFIPFKEMCNAVELSYIFLKEVVKQHRLPTRLYWTETSCLHPSSRLHL